MTDVGVDCKMPSGVDAGQDGEGEADQNSRFRETDAAGDDLNNYVFKHCFSCSAWGAKETARAFRSAISVMSAQDAIAPGRRPGSCRRFEFPGSVAATLSAEFQIEKRRWEIRTRLASSNLGAPNAAAS